MSSRFGKLLFDGHGFVLYAFTRDKVGGKSTCYGDCAAAWPPYLLKGKRTGMRAGLGRRCSERRSASTGSSRSRTQADPSTTTAATRSPDTSFARTCSSTAGGGSWSRAPASSSADVRRRGGYRALVADTRLLAGSAAVAITGHRLLAAAELSAPGDPAFVPRPVDQAYARRSFLALPNCPARAGRLHRATAVGRLHVTANGPTLPRAGLLRLAGKMAARMTRP